MSSELSWVEYKGSPSMRICLQRYRCVHGRIHGVPLCMTSIRVLIHTNANLIRGHARMNSFNPISIEIRSSGLTLLTAVFG